MRFWLAFFAFLHDCGVIFIVLSGVVQVVVVVVVVVVERVE